MSTPQPAEIRERLKSATQLTPSDVQCLECGYEGPMELVELPWYVRWLVLLPVLSIIATFACVAIGIPQIIGWFVAYGVMLVIEGMFARYRCPSCQQWLSPK